MAIPRKLTDNFIETEVDGEVLLVDLAGGELFSLDGTAAAIWRLIDGTRDVGAIARTLQAGYEAVEGVIARDCGCLIDELAQAGVVAINA